MNKMSYAITHNGPATGKLACFIGRFWMRLWGWKVHGQPPAASKYILIAAHHTSNWDFPFMLAATAMFRLKVSWIGKHTLFRRPFGGLMRKLGGIPIDRSSPQGLVKAMVQKFTEADKLVVVIPPSGTREKRDHWKSGFYRIAHAAQIPLCCGYLDFKRKEAGYGIAFIPSGDVKNDMDQIRDFYKNIHAKKPHKATTVRLRDENNGKVNSK